MRAINKGLIDSLKEPDASVAAVAKREPLIKTGVERERFDATLQDEMNHPEIAKIGLGNADPERLKKSIDILVEANGSAAHADGRGNLHAGLPAAGRRSAEEAVLTASCCPLPQSERARMRTLQDARTTGKHDEWTCN